MRRFSRSASDNAAWMVAMRNWPCFRIGTSKWTFLLPDGLSRIRHRHDFVSQKLFGLFDAALQITDGVHLSKIHADGDEGLGDFRGKTGDDNGRTKEARGFDGLDEVVRDRNVHGGHTGNVNNDGFRAIR